MDLVSCERCGSSMRAGTEVCPSCEHPMPANATPVPAIPVPTPPPFIPAAPSSTGWGPPAAPPAPVAPTVGAGVPQSVPAVPPGVPVGSTNGAPSPSTSPPRRGPLVLGVVLMLAAIAAGVWFLQPSEPAFLTGPWKRTLSPSGAYSIEFPASARRTQRTVDKPPLLTFNVSALSVGDGGLEQVAPGAVMLESTLTPLADLPPELVTDSFRATVLGEAVGASIETIGAGSLQTKPAEGLLGPGLTFTATDGEGLHLEGLAVLDGTQVIGVVVTVPDGDEPAARRAVDRFRRTLRRA